MGVNVPGNLQTITRSSNQGLDLRGELLVLMFYLSGIEIKLSFLKYNIGLLTLLYILVPLVMVLQFMTDLN